MDIVLLNTWITNIGNGFIDKGAKSCVKQSLREANIREVSGLGNEATSQLEFNYIFDKLRYDFGLDIPILNAFKKRSVNVAELLDADVAVLSGCVLSRHLEWYEETLKNISDRDIPLVLLGVGGESYDQRTVKKIKNKLQKLNVAGIITRDDAAFEEYSEVTPNIYRGIDCGFFINDWYNPPSSNQQFVASTFDHNPDPIYQTDQRIIRPNHRSLLPTHNGLIPNILRIIAQKYKERDLALFDSGSTFVSDSLKDYLFIYSNATETHADRIHACVPTLVYDNPTKFYHETPRSGLFEGLTSGNITNEIVTINNKNLSDEKNKQIKYVRDIIEDI